MSIIAATSQALIAHIQQLCGAYLREIDEHPGNWDESTIRRLVRNPPAVYVAWLGQTPDIRPHSVLARWGVFVVCDVLNGQRQDNIGIYQVVETLTAGLHRQRIEPSGLFELETVQNLWSDTQSDMGVAVYGLYFKAQQGLAPLIEASELDDFKIYHHQFKRSEQQKPDKHNQLTITLPTKEH